MTTPILLIHGQGRSPLSLYLLAWRLRPHPITYFSYACWKNSLNQIINRFINTLNQTYPHQPYIIISHSLGGIITRAALPHLTNPPQHLIMLAPPNQPALMAKKIHRNPLYRLFTRDCGTKLASDNFYKTLPLPTIPTTIIAGTKGLYGSLSPFKNNPNDMALSVAETKLTPTTQVILTPARHSFIMNSPQVARIILAILNNNKKTP